MDAKRAENGWGVMMNTNVHRLCIDTVIKKASQN